MESSLIKFWFKEIPPLNELFFIIWEELDFRCKPLKFESKGLEGFLFFVNGMFKEEFEDKIEIEGHFVGEGFVGLK